MKIFSKATVSGFGTTSSGGYTSNTLKEVGFEFMCTSRPLRNNCRIFAAQVDVDIWRNSDCQLVQWSGFFKVKITDNMLCAGQFFGGSDSCQVVFDYTESSTLSNFEVTFYVRETLEAPWSPSKVENMKCQALSLLAKDVLNQSIWEYMLTPLVSHLLIKITLYLR